MLGITLKVLLLKIFFFFLGGEVCVPLEPPPLPESIAAPATLDNSITVALNHVGYKIRVIFDRSCLKQDKIKFNQGK